MMPEPCHDEVCVTCSDQLTPMRVEAITPDGLTAYGAQAGERREVALDLLADVQVGDTVLVHGGIALQRAEEQSSAQEVDHD
jgi:hydrogenase maturation factor